MADGCRQENHANAGLELGAFIGAAALEGRDKLTVVLRRRSRRSACGSSNWSPRAPANMARARCRSSTKPLGRPDEYGSDRAFVAIATDVDAPDADAAPRSKPPAIRCCG